MKTPERRVKDEVRQVLTDLGAYFFMPVQTGYGASTLDFLCCVNGRFIGIETKAGKAQASRRQELVIEQINKAGGLAFVAWSGDDVRRMLK